MYAREGRGARRCEVWGLVSNVSAATAKGSASRVQPALWASSRRDEARTPGSHPSSRPSWAWPHTTPVCAPGWPQRLEALSPGAGENAGAGAPPDASNRNIVTRSQDAARSHRKVQGAGPAGGAHEVREETFRKVPWEESARKEPSLVLLHSQNTPNLVQSCKKTFCARFLKIEK